MRTVTRTEGILPKKYQSPREIYHPSDRIRALIYEVAKSPTGLQIILTRTHADFVRKSFELNRSGMRHLTDGFKRLAISQQTACSFGQAFTQLVWLPMCVFYDQTIRHQLGLDDIRGYWSPPCDRQIKPK